MKSGFQNPPKMAGNKITAEILNLTKYQKNVNVKVQLQDVCHKVMIVLLEIIIC